MSLECLYIIGTLCIFVLHFFLLLSLSLSHSLYTFVSLIFIIDVLIRWDTFFLLSKATLPYRLLDIATNFVFFHYCTRGVTLQGGVLFSVIWYELECHQETYCFISLLLLVWFFFLSLCCHCWFIRNEAQTQIPSLDGSLVR